MSHPMRSPKHVQVGVELVPAHLRPVLAALLSGATDVAASHRLNMSPRTLSRRVAELLEYLHVQTRFQAGVEIASRSWRAAMRVHSGLTVVDLRPMPPDQPIAGRWPVTSAVPGSGVRGEEVGDHLVHRIGRL